MSVFFEHSGDSQSLALQFAVMPFTLWCCFWCVYVLDLFACVCFGFASQTQFSNSSTILHYWYGNEPAGRVTLCQQSWCIYVPFATLTRCTQHLIPMYKHNTYTLIGKFTGWVFDRCWSWDAKWMGDVVVTRETQQVAGGHKGKLTCGRGGYHHKWDTCFQAQTKRRTTPKAKTHTGKINSSAPCWGTSCQSWCSGQDEDSLSDSQDAVTMQDPKRTTATLSKG